jgi:hypothetical protein
MSPWEFETSGTEESKQDGYRLLGLREHFPVHTAVAIRRGDLSNLDFRFDNEYDRSLDRSVIDEMVAEGLI